MLFNSFNAMKDYEERKGSMVLHDYPAHNLTLSDEADSRSSGEAKKLKTENKEPGLAGDGASIELVRRPRGRPPGSKNKPKPPVIITREVEPTSAMRPHVLEVPAGHDVADCLARFSRRRNVGVCILAGTGAVANVTLRQPPVPNGAAEGSTICFRGRFEILSISATFLPPPITAVSGHVSISLAGPHGQVVGGIVAGPLVAAGTVMVVAAAFSNPTFHRLPLTEDEEVAGSVTVSGGGGDVEAARGQGEQEQDEGPLVHHLHQQQRLQVPPGGAESCAMSMYSCHDVIWAPTARPPPPPPY